MNEGRKQLLDCLKAFEPVPSLKHEQPQEKGEGAHKNEDRSKFSRIGEVGPQKNHLARGPMMRLRRP